MNAEQIKSSYAEKLAAYEKAEGEYRQIQNAIGQLIEEKRGFHRDEYVSHVYAMDDKGNIYYHTASNDSDCDGGGKIHISEIATD